MELAGLLFNNHRHPLNNHKPQTIAHTFLTTIDHHTPSSGTHLFSEPHKVGLLILCEHPKVRIEDLLEQQHKELFLNTSLILPWFISKDHLQGRWAMNEQLKPFGSK